MRLVVLDRDGTINHDSADYIRSTEAWQAIPGSLDAMARLSRAGWTVTIATNQSGLARGYFDRATLDAMHQKLLSQLAALGGHVAHIAVCPHAPDAGCACRKPAPGLLDEIAALVGVPADTAVVIGDSQKDLDMARARGARAVLVRTGNGRATEAALREPTETYDDLAAAVDALLKKRT